MGTPTLSYSDFNGHHAVSLDRDATSVGRSPTQDVVLNDPCVSRLHAAIRRIGNSYAVEDRGSAHGTFLNSVRVKRSILQFEDVLQLGSLGGLRLRFHLSEHNENASDVARSSVTTLLPSLNELRGLGGKAEFHVHCCRQPPVPGSEEDLERLPEVGLSI